VSRIISTESPYMPAAPGVEASVLAVLVQDGQGKYRAYIAMVPHLDDRMSQEQRRHAANWVASQGRKMTFREAVPVYFTGFTEKDYAS
jgi:hypothetical protein